MDGAVCESCKGKIEEDLVGTPWSMCWSCIDKEDSHEIDRIRKLQPVPLKNFLL